MAVAVFLALATTSRAETIDELVKRAIAANGRTDTDAWSYTMSETRNGVPTVSRFDPSKPEAERWTLVSKERRAPTASEMTEFRKERSKRDEKRKEREVSKARANDKQDDGNDIDDMIEPGSLKLISETTERAVCSFRMRAEDDDDQKFAEKVHGTLVVNRTGPYVESIELLSTGEIKPMTGVKISAFQMKLVFSWDAATRSALPLSIRSKVQGRALLLKKLDEDMTIAFSDFKFHGTAPR